ncbi:MAG: hypothetical protein KDA83_07785 [Planctomycetales bacterium]|nr:hypothetical protein [Planctomycetales bacterium]
MVKRPKYTEETAISFYDQVSGLISAGVFFLAFIVAVLFLLWLSVMASRARINTAVEVVGPELGEDEKPEGEADDIEEPGSEFPEVETPQLADALEALSSAVSNIAASDREVDGSAEAMGAGRGLGSRGGGGLGNGGPGPWERWEIRYTTASRDAYAQQLDGLGIELGAIQREGPAIVYITNLSRGMATRSGTKSQEKRVFFNYNRGVLRDWDIQFAEAAGVNLRDKLLVQFYPPTIQQTLLELERRKLGGRTVEEVYRTVFGVRPAGGSFEFYVIDQTYK